MAKPCYFKNDKEEVVFIIDASEVESLERTKMDVYEGDEEIPNGFWRKLFGLPTEKRMKYSMQNCTKVTMKSGHKYWFFERDGFTFDKVSTMISFALS